MDFAQYTIRHQECLALATAVVLISAIRKLVPCMMSWTRKKLFVGQETLPPHFINSDMSNLTPCTTEIMEQHNWNNKLSLTHSQNSLFLIS